jgi:hypothetical protein
MDVNGSPGGQYPLLLASDLSASVLGLPQQYYLLLMLDIEMSAFLLGLFTRQLLHLAACLAHSCPQKL